MYTSFQHDQSAVPAYTAMGYRNIMWGDDYPHLEGTYGHTQETLHKLFDGAPDDAVRAITTTTFEKLFHTPPLTAVARATPILHLLLGRRSNAGRSSGR